MDPKYHRHFVIKRGEVLRQIGEEFGGVVVSFPRSGVDSDQVIKSKSKVVMLASFNSHLVQFIWFVDN